MVDEVHALAGTKRGDQLALGLARLAVLAPSARRVGLSATVAHPDPLRRYLSPTGRVEDVALVTAKGGAAPRLDIMLPEGRLPWGGHMGLASMPEVSSLKDAGFNAEYAQWSGLFIPSATPEPVAQRIRAAARAAAQDAKVKEIILGAGSPVQFQDSPDFEKYVQADAKRMVDVVKKIGKVE